MKAVRIFGKNDVRLVEVDRPQPQAGEVLLKIGAAGVCHSDLHVIENNSFPQKQPFTLGHENAGWVEQVGAGVHHVKKGDAVIVYGPWGCGHCHACQQSQENYCEHQHEMPYLGGGLGHDGGMAEYMLVPSERLLVPLGNLSPLAAAPLTDAALTPYHAIKRSAHKITPSSFVLVQGVGGLGHMALQILKHSYNATLIACDIDDSKLQLAKEHGADHVINSGDPKAADIILSLTGPKKCSLVLDFVGINATLNLGKTVVGLNGDWTIVGLGGGAMNHRVGELPYGVNVCTPYWGSRDELMEVLSLAEKGVIQVESEIYPLTEALAVYDKLRNGEIKGRAVLQP